MIKNLKNKGLKRLFYKNDVKLLPPDLIDKITIILASLESSKEIKNMALPGYRLHALTGNYNGFWSVTVSGNMRIIFRFDEDEGNALDVDFIDYHSK